MTLMRFFPILQTEKGTKPWALRNYKPDARKSCAWPAGAGPITCGCSARWPDPASDGDFLVDMEPDQSLLDLGGLWQDPHELLGVQVDVVTEAGLRHRIRERVLKESVSPLMGE